MLSELFPSGRFEEVECASLQASLRRWLFFQMPQKTHLSGSHQSVEPFASVS